MNAPLPSKTLARPSVADANAQRVVRRLWNAIAELRASKTSISKAKSWLPQNDDNDELQLVIRAIYENAERRCVKLARKYEAIAAAHEGRKP